MLIPNGMVVVSLVDCPAQLTFIFMILYLCLSDLSDVFRDKSKMTNMKNTALTATNQ